ncbi:MAG: hypothetical protein PHN61_12990 [Methanothrix sp.]|nr:hypothetical protein [Methanothrix sp.]
MAIGMPFADASANGYISKVWWPEGVFYKNADKVKVIVEIKNSGSKANEFWVGFSVRGPDGEWKDVEPQSAYLPKGEKTQMKFNWRVTRDAPRGAYDATVALWEDYDGSSMIGELDRKTKNKAFKIK